MLKRLLILAVVLLLAGLLGLAWVVRKLPDLAVQNIRQTLGREVSIGVLRVDFPLRLRMDRLLVTENEPFKGEPAFYVERVEASVDAWEFLTSKKIVFTDVTLVRPRMIFRKTGGKLYHAFRIRPSAAPAASPANAATSRPSVPPLRFDRIRVRDGEAQLMDYDADAKGFVVTLLRLSADLDDLTLPSDGSRLAFKAEGFLSQGRETPPARLTVKGHWTRETLEGRSELELSGVQLPYFEPYYRNVTPSRISDGELDLVATADSPNGILTSNSNWKLRRLTFDRSEPGNELLGFDANLIRNILADDAGNLGLDLVVTMDLRDRSTRFRDVLRNSIRRSVKATFLANFDTAVKNTVERIASDGSDLFKDKNWKDLIKKNKIEDVVNQVMNPD